MKKHGPLKFYVTLKITLYKVINDEELDEATEYFRCEARNILHISDFDHVYQEGVYKIWNLFDEWFWLDGEVH